MLQVCIILLVVGILALALEVIMPGYDGFVGGVLGVIALFVSSVLAVLYVPGGWWFVGVSGTVLLICIYFAQRYIRHGQLHGKIVHSETLAEDLPSLDVTSLVGKEGKAATRLGPSGEAEFSGIRVAVTTGGLMLERGTLVKVVEACGNRVLVQAVHGN